ncbi:AT-rich binding protein-like [Aphis craccivora]|uniref:AT-rich binding protein-like n=1 Tax=Aphis craccivora TaxID=307492 RepID=A0A6G0ZHY4_APHCR|nr:AT-rich binding protein-like [Aphis craccivora]
MFKTVRAQHGAGNLVAELEYTILPQTDDRSPSASSGEDEPPTCSAAVTAGHRTHLHHHHHHQQQQQQQQQKQQHQYQYRYHQHSRDASQQPQSHHHHHHHRRSSSSSSSSATADDGGGGGGGAGTRRTVVVIIAMLVLGCGVVAAAVLVPILLAARLVTVPASARLQTFAVAASGVIHSARGDYVQLLPVKHAPPGTVINFGPPPPPPPSTGHRRKRRSVKVVKPRRSRPITDVRHRKPVRTDDRRFRSLDFRIRQ